MEGEQIRDIVNNIHVRLCKEEEEKMSERKEQGKKFPLLSAEELKEILNLTIKQDDANKLITFLCCLSAYTENSQFNLSFNAPSSSGKSYIPTQVSALFPKEDVIKLAYASPMAFFHDQGVFDKEKGGYYVDLERKILIFLDQPHIMLLEHLRPLLSHDEKEMQIKIADKTQKHGLRTKNIVVKGYPAVIFCTAGLKVDEQEATRFLLLSPETTPEKIRQGVSEVLDKESDSEGYLKKLDDDPDRRLLIERIKAIKGSQIKEIKIKKGEKAQIKEWFMKRHKMPIPRLQRDIKRLTSIIKVFSLLNLWHREFETLHVIFVSEEDISAGFEIWEDISLGQELNLPPYIYQFYKEVVLPLYQEKEVGLTRGGLLQGHLRIYGRPLPDWQLRRDIIPMLEMAGLVTQEKDPDDKRNKLIFPVLEDVPALPLDPEDLDKLNKVKDVFGGEIMM